jgi:5-methylcytosine-specific restriction endonuclease McrA
MCRESPSGLHVHHLNGNPADNRPDNLITLCAHCHMLMHKHEKRKPKRWKPKKPQKTELKKGILDYFM